MFNTTEGWQSLKDSQSIRAAALHDKVPYFTTAAASLAAARAIEALRGHALEVRSLQSYYSASRSIILTTIRPEQRRPCEAAPRRVFDERRRDNGEVDKVPMLAEGYREADRRGAGA